MGVSKKPAAKAGKAKRKAAPAPAAAKAKRRRQQAEEEEEASSASESGEEQELDEAQVAELKAQLRKRLEKALAKKGKKAAKPSKAALKKAQEEMMAIVDSSSSSDEEESEEDAAEEGEDGVEEYVLGGDSPDGPNNGAVEGRGVVYLGRVPFGFFEDQMKDFFSQFGEVTRLRLARSKRTGNSKGYAFVEFEDEETAEVVAEAMDGYMMFERALQCHVVPADKVHPQLFRGANRKFRRVPWARIARDRHNRDRSDEEKAKRRGKLLKKEAAQRKKLAAMGIDYAYQGYAEHAAALGIKTAEKKEEKKPAKKAPKKGKVAKRAAPEETEAPKAKKAKKAAAAEKPAKKAKKAKKSAK